MDSLRTIAKSAASSPQAIRQLWQSPAVGARDVFGPWSLARSCWTAAFITDGDRTQPELDEPYTLLAQAALQYAETFLALDIANEGSAALAVLQPQTESESRTLRSAVHALTHVKALALARSGSIVAANEQLSQLYERDKDDPEVVGALARTFKDFALKLPSASKQHRQYLERSHQLYLAGYETSSPRSTFLGVNAAATALWLGDGAKASALAREVERQCQAELAVRPDDYWVLATLAEVYLLNMETARAADFYGQARRTIEHSRRWADLSTSRRQAQRHCKDLGIDPAPFEAAMKFPRLAVFAGHLVDAPGRAVPRFPDDPALIAQIAGEIRDWLERENIGFAQCAAGCGADLIFINELRRRGAEVHVVLPWREADFIASSVRPGGEHWVREYERLRDDFSSLTCLSQQTLPSARGTGFEYCNCCINGIALQRARELGAEIRPLAVWDGQPGDGPGGTASFIGFWQRRALVPEIIGLPAPAVAAPERVAVFRPMQEQLHEREEIKISRGQQAIKTLLFADVVGYSRINEAEIEHFAPQFLGAVSALIARAGLRQPIQTNTWGDAIYLVFDEATDAGVFALQLRGLIQSTRWEERGLPADLDVRISLHTGPVLLCVDPVIRQMTFTGSHVSHASRIEPIVEKGEIYATEAFVAFLEIARSNGEAIGFECDYLGQVDFAKGYGRYPLFRLRDDAHVKLSGD